MIKYYGGKSWIGKYLGMYLPETLPKTFVDVFVGGGNVVDKVYKRFDRCIINDIDKNLINFYRVIKECDFEDTIRYFEKRRSELKYEDIRTIKQQIAEPPHVTKQELAFMYLTMNRCGFGGKIYGTGTVANFERYLSYDFRHNLQKVKDVLDFCDIKNEDYRELNFSDCFLYFDPPYCDVSSQNYYGNKGQNHRYFDHTEFKKFVDILGQSNKVMVSYEDSTFIRDLWKDYTIVNIPKKTVFYSSSNESGGSTQTDEVLILNYKPVCDKFVDCSLF